MIINLFRYIFMIKVHGKLTEVLKNLAFENSSNLVCLTFYS